MATGCACRVPSRYSGVPRRRASYCWGATWMSWKDAAQQQPCSHQVQQTT
jgi:hypothetical protein